MPTRREFIGALGLPAVAFAGAQLDLRRLVRERDRLAELARTPGSAESVARDEKFWAEVQRAFTVDRSLINFNNGGVSPAPAMVQNAMADHLAFSNKAPTYTMWKVLEPQRETVRARIAKVWGVDTEELAFTRNASESLQTCQFGFDLEPGDEILTTDQDYGRMITTFRQRERRDAVKLVQIELPIPCEDDAEVVRRFERAITPRTKLILICHMINTTGQILPVREVVAMARKRGIPTIVDGAHSFAHFDFKLSDLDCDYFGTSLHKWLFAPHGTGLLYVRKDKIDGLWPLMGARENQGDDIRKFEEIGTHPAANALAIAEALTFHLGIGAERKQARLIFLRDAWAKRLAKLPNAILHTSLAAGYACGIACVGIHGIPPAKISEHLMAAHRIITAPIKHSRFAGVRVSPSVYSTMAEIECFVDAMERVAKNGLPS